MLSWDVKYIGKVERGEGIKSFRFERPDDFVYLPGQFFIIAFLDDAGRRLVHHFSFSSSPTEPFIEFTTRMRDSDFKNAIDRLFEGAIVNIMEAQGVFTLGDDVEKVTYICGGIGITPARSVIRWAVDTSADIDIMLLYANRNLPGTAFKEEFDGLEDDGVRVVFVLSRPDAGWTGPTGHIDADLIKREVPDWRDRFFYVSGPPVMVDAVRGALLKGVGVSLDRVRVENFTGY